MSARPPETAGGAGAHRPAKGTLVFTVAGQEMSLPIDRVLEIIRRRDVTPLAHAASSVQGILTHRGRMVTVVDVRRGLALAPRARGPRSQVIVIDSAGDLLGLAVDAVLRVEDAAPGATPLDLQALLKGLS